MAIEGIYPVPTYSEVLKMMMEATIDYSRPIFNINIIDIDTGNLLYITLSNTDQDYYVVYSVKA